MNDGRVTAHNVGTAQLRINNTSITTSDITVVDSSLRIMELDPLPLLYQLTLTSGASSPSSQGTLTVNLLTQLFVGEQVKVTASLLPSDGHRLTLNSSGLALSTVQTSRVTIAGPWINGTSSGSAWINVSTECSGSNLTASFKVDIIDPSPPVFRLSQANASVFENASVGDFVFAANTYLTNASLVHLLTYTITGSTQFSVDSEMGVVRVNGLLDYNSVRSYKINITATDYRDRSTVLLV